MNVYKISKRQRIKFRIRKKIHGSASVPRLTVYRSNSEVYAQLIDDVEGRTLLSISTKSKSLDKKGTKMEQAKVVGKVLAEQAKEQKISRCRFDRNGYLYHGRVKALAEAAKNAGLQF